MQRLYCVIGYKTYEDVPVINGRQTREMILDEAKDISSDDVKRLVTAIDKLHPVVENVYRINPVLESAAEFHDSIKSLQSDNVEATLTVDRRFRSYTLEFDMFLDYWEACIAHHKRIDGSTDQKLIAEYKNLFKTLTHEVYDNNTEYQMLDLIRNQTAHVQSPVNRIHVGINCNEAYSDRDILLSKCQSKENKKKRLEAQPEELALSPIVDVTAKCLSEIHDKLMDYQI
ncbi:MAG: hypothetical protein J6H31_16865 [Butyrivibrio sp.]|nr:hypothetical protein [Butyrivibrio sp.]